MLQILFAIVLFESECSLYLHRQEYPLFLPLVFVLRNTRSQQPHASLSEPGSGEESGFEVLKLGGCRVAGKPGLPRGKFRSTGKR